MPNYTIWVSYHKDEFIREYNLQEDEHHKLFPTHRSPDTGININHLNPVYSEMVTMWYVWKNNIRTDYVGFEHYRRHLPYKGLPDTDEAQVFTEFTYPHMTIQQQYNLCHNSRDFEMIMELIDEKYGEDNLYNRYFRENHSLLGCCTFIVSWDDFCRLCEFMFPILQEFGKRCGMEDGYGTVDMWHKKAEEDFPDGDEEKINYQTRVISFLAERMISAWLVNNLRCYT